MEPLPYPTCMVDPVGGVPLQAVAVPVVLEEAIQVAGVALVVE